MPTTIACEMRIVAGRGDLELGAGMCTNKMNGQKMPYLCVTQTETIHPIGTDLFAERGQGQAHPHFVLAFENKESFEVFKRSVAYVQKFFDEQVTS